MKAASTVAHPCVRQFSSTNVRIAVSPSDN